MLSIAAFLFYFVLTSSLTTLEDVNVILVAFMASLIFQSSLGILQYITGLQFDLFSTGRGLLGEGFNLRGRGFGTNINRPNGFPGLISPLLFIGISVLFGTKSYRKLVAVSSMIGLMGLAVSFSRGAWIGFFAGLMVLVLSFYREGLFATTRAWKIVAPAMLLLIMLFPFLRARAVNDYMNPAMISGISSNDSGYQDDRDASINRSWGKYFP